MKKKSKSGNNPENISCEDAIVMRLILGNIGDEVALKNICEVHGMERDELDEKAKEFLIDTNHFYHSVEEFNTLHREESDEQFNYLLKEELLIKTTNGYVWINCV